MHRKKIHRHLTSKEQTLEPNSPSGQHSAVMVSVILGSYFFDGNLNGLAYLRMLNEFAFPQLAIHFNNQFWEGLFRGLWWAQDGAPAHRLIEVRDRLNKVFGELGENRVIDVLRQRRIEEFNALRRQPEMIRHVMRGMHRRTIRCVERNGGHVEGYGP